MYLMVFAWPEALVSARVAVSEWQEKPPFGLIFSNFMAATTLGSLLFKAFSRASGGVPSSLMALKLTMATAAASLVTSVLARSEFSRFLAFCVFELALGGYFPSIGHLKSMAVGDEQRASLYGLMRIPLNVYVQVALVTVQEGDSPFATVGTSANVSQAKAVAA